MVAEFEERFSTEVKRQKKLDLVEEQDFRRGKLLQKYTARMLYEWSDGKLEKVGEELAKIEVSFSRRETLKE